jgi:hypothetical protein
VDISHLAYSPDLHPIANGILILQLSKEWRYIGELNNGGLRHLEVGSVIIEESECQFLVLAML